MRVTRLQTVSGDNPRGGYYTFPLVDRMIDEENIAPASQINLTVYTENVQARKLEGFDFRLIYFSCLKSLIIIGLKYSLLVFGGEGGGGIFRRYN